MCFRHEIHTSTCRSLFKWRGAYAFSDKSAASVSSAIFQKLICEIGGLHRQLHSDQATEFMKQVMKELCKIVGVERSTTKGCD